MEDKKSSNDYIKHDLEEMYKGKGLNRLTEARHIEEKRLIHVITLIKEKKAMDEEKYSKTQNPVTEVKPLEEEQAVQTVISEIEQQCLACKGSGTNRRYFMLLIKLSFLYPAFLWTAVFVSDSSTLWVGIAFLLCFFDFIDMIRGKCSVCDGKGRIVTVQKSTRNKFDES